MGILNWIGLGKDLSEPIKAVGDLYTTDKARSEAQAKLEETMQKPVLAQMEINKTLALSSHIFNSGWQPLIGWSAGFLILLYWGPQIVIANYIWIKKCMALNQMVPFPIKPDEIMNIIYVAFGFGGYALINKKIS